MGQPMKVAVGLDQAGRGLQGLGIYELGEGNHAVLHLAVGGDWGGCCGVDAGAFPQEYRVDWVRVYQ
jgi:hypothetical protein